MSRTTSSVPLQVLRLAVSALLGCGVALWFGLAFLSYAAFSEEGIGPSDSVSRLLLGELVLLLGLLGMVIALRLLWMAKASRLLAGAILAVGLLQAAIFASALSLSHFVRSGLAWQTSAWRRLLHDLLLVELFAYYPWVGVLAFAVIAAVVGVGVAKLIPSRERVETATGGSNC